MKTAVRCAPHRPRFVGIWKRQFRMAYVYFKRGYSFRLGFLNGRPEVGIKRTHWHPRNR